MEDDLDTRDLDDFVESIELGDIGDDLDIELVLVLWVVVPDFAGLLLIPHGRDNIVPLL